MHISAFVQGTFLNIKKQCPSYGHFMDQYHISQAKSEKDLL